jgi:hypothetical protein
VSRKATSPGQSNATPKEGTRKRRVRCADLTIESDVRVPEALAPWERELLLPIVRSLLEDAFLVGNNGEDVKQPLVIINKAPDK